MVQGASTTDTADFQGDWAEIMKKLAFARGGK